MSGEVVLSSALRSNLLSLQRTQSNIDKVQNVLATGLKVSSALDNPQSFFASQALKNRSSDLTKLLDGIGQSIQTIKAADGGVTALNKLVQQASSIVDSARDAITNGSKEASVAGNADLSGVKDVTSLTGVSDGAELTFTYKKSDGSIATLHDAGQGAGSVSLNTGDSIQKLITKINDLTATGSTDSVLHAELTSAGKLKITALNGGSFNLAFDADGNGAAAATSTTDLAFASALGFGGIAGKTTSSSGITSGVQLNEVSVTALSSTKLTSGAFYKQGATGFADASDLLTAVDSTDSGGTARFSAGASAVLRFTVNGSKTSADINIGTTSIQGLVDKINTDSSIGNLVTAAYDKTNGQFTIAAKDGSVSTVKVEATSATGEALTKADFGFGVKGFQAGAAATNVAETFTLATAASTLSQYENDYNTVRNQINDLVKDSGYRGVNLIKGDTLDTFFNEDRSNKLSTKGTNLDSDGLGIAKADFSRIETIETAADQSRAAQNTLRSFGSTLSNSLSIIQTRQDFTTSLINTLDEGSDKLTLADQNEEGAKLLALQTRQSLGVTALSLAAQAQQSVLRLF